VQLPKGAFKHSWRLFTARLEEGRSFDADEMYPFPVPFSAREQELLGFEY
jgi:hypothetical protein